MDIQFNICIFLDGQVLFQRIETWRDIGKQAISVKTNPIL